jgi:hypothetical protein
MIKKLLTVKDIAKSNPNDPFYIPSSVDKVQICENFLVFKDRGQIILLDKITGLVNKRLKIDGNDFLLNPQTNSLLTYSNELNQVVNHDFNGKSQTFDITISNPNKCIHFLDCLSDK